MKLIIRYFREAVQKFPKEFAAAMGMLAMLTLMETAIPWGMRVFLDEVTTQKNYGILWIGGAVFACILLIQIFMNIQRFAALDRFGGRYIAHLTVTLESNMSQTTYSEIEKIQPSIIRNILYTDVLNVFRGIGHFIPSMLGALAVLLASFGIGLFYDLQVSAFIFVAIAMGLLLSWASRTILARVAGQTNAKLKNHDAWCTQFVEMLPLIQTHDVLSYYQKKTKENLSDFISTAIVEDKKIYFWTGLVSRYHSLFSIVLSAMLAIPAANGNISNLVFFTMLANLAMQQAQSLESLFQQCMRVYASFGHVDSLRQLPLRDGKEKLELISSLDFADVSFRYANGVQALKHVDCHLQAGDVVHISGTNGSGKSTFIKLITGLYRAESGQIRFNGQPADRFAQSTRNRQILYINQDEKLLNETFRNYLVCITGKPISQDACSRLLEALSLPGDGREISGNGSSLSVGQRKKLLILKMMLRKEDASVIILDEVTAGLDAQTTDLFYKQMEDLAKLKRTIILLVDHTLEDRPFVNKKLHFAEGNCEMISVPNKSFNHYDSQC